MTNKNQSSSSVQVVGMKHLAVGVGVAGVLFLILARAVESGSREEILGAAGLFAAGAGLVAAVGFGLLDLYNSRIGGIGRLYLAIEQIVSRNEAFLFDNPALSNRPAIRRALLPTEEELAAIPFHHSFKTTLREFREGRHWFMHSGARGGESYSVNVESAEVAYYRAQAASAVRERNVLAVELQRLRRRLVQLEGPKRGGAA